MTPHLSTVDTKVHIISAQAVGKIHALAVHLHQRPRSVLEHITGIVSRCCLPLTIKGRDHEEIPPRSFPVGRRCTRCLQQELGPSRFVGC
ncbi:hypothetical protein EFP18_21375 [Burkholderia glumae]|nr:hypothetical protein Y5A_003975 [Burkholderia glumae AU6208]PNL03094.1 hypothetical protein CEQ24_018525 [Burkholderia glumae]QGA39293.1 hypothetical protein GAS19_05675 [Burkholderia glumae]QHP92460.1 hypothetical protein EXE55_04835 [Burkholderia glumae]RQZ74660.1 hypothetical protein DF052_08770 [Burkholderia glumae]